MLLRQVDEWAFRNHQESQLFEHLPSRGRNKSVSHSGNVNEIVSTVISDDDGIETVSAREVSADHQFLSAIHAILYPGATALSGLIYAVLSLCDDPFESLLSNSPEHIRCGCFDIIGSANSRRLKLQYRPHNFATLGQGKTGKVTTVIDEEIKNEE